MSDYKRRVALICFSRSLGGLELSTLRLAKAMNNRGIPVLLVLPPGSPLEERAHATALETASLAPRWKYGDLTAVLPLARILKSHRTELAVLTQSKDIHLAACAALLHPGTKLVFYQQMNSQRSKRDLLHTWFFSKLSLWISLTQRMRDDVLTYTRMPREKVKVVPLGTDLRKFDPSQYEKSSTRAHFGLPHHKRIVGVLGRLDAQKGQDIVLRAVPKVIRQHPDAYFLIVGDETVGEAGYGKYLQGLCVSLGIEDHVRFLPFTDDVPHLMAALDVFTLPSFSETFGLVVVEAMAMERPVIATNAGGIPEIITNGKTGLLIQPRDSNALAHAIHRILSDRSLRSSLAHSARVEALDRYDFDACVDALLGAFSTV